MADAPDPMGKRALYWAPAQRHEEGPRQPDDAELPGKHALYSDAAVSPGSPHRRRGKPRSSRPRPPVDGTVPETDPRGALSLAGGPDDLERPAGSGMFGSLILHCSSCRVRSQVDLVEFVVLHLPLWLWRPGRGYTTFMTCPACRRRTWMSASWTSRSR
jgi:hypothetical protein